MNVLLLGAEHPVAIELTERLPEAHFNQQQVFLPSLDETPSEALFEEISGQLPQAVVFAPQVPLSRLSFRRRLHLVDIVKKICAAVSPRNVPFIHLSSPLVYDGKLDRAYTEEDKPNPSSDLSKVWRRWETLVQRQFSRHIILRPGWIIGRQASLSSELKQVLGYHAAPDTVVAAKGNPVEPAEIARVIVALLKQINVGAQNFGIFHVAGDDVVSSAWILERVAPDSYLRVDQGSKDLNYELDCQKILNAFGVQQRAW